MAWRAANSLVTLRNQTMAEHPSAAPPHTDVNSWGLVCDLAHTTSSSHCPHDFPGWGNDIVTAADIPHAPSLGLDAHAMAEHMRQVRDFRVLYILSNGRQTGVNHKNSDGTWRWDPYTGSDPHDTHIHVNTVQDSRADDPRAWDLGGTMPLVQSDANLVAATVVNTPDFLFLANRVAALTALLETIPGGPEQGAAVPFSTTIKKINGIVSTQAAHTATLTTVIQSLTEMKTILSEVLAAGTSVDAQAIITAINNAQAALFTAQQVAQLENAAQVGAERASDS